ncbi:hypothetical protein CH35J_003703 [Colletotrichum higginsianum]|uniref:Uncharacterized protein n=1 Tax=Colletotrichum higginsianum TaxID=80884 RepID=A0A4T0W9B3_9PEZI|nr:hypothetical protein CH35J_003703 [Colletotrichum higginsianum]
MVSMTAWPYVLSGFLVDQTTRAGTRRSMSTGRQGPMPEPVATRTIFLKSGATASTPEAGVPRVQMEVGGFSMMRLVQSPALETTMEKPLPLGSGIAAKACHSTMGRSVMRTPREVQGPGVQKSKCRRTACLERGSGTTLTRRRRIHGRAMLSVVRATR